MNGIKQQNNTIRITSFPRVHITLIGMNNDGYRINGSVGFSISAPEIDIDFMESNEIEILDEREIKFTEQEKARLYHVLLEAANKLSLKKKIRCLIKGYALPHYGLGSNTAIYMSCIEALFVTNKTEYNQDDIITYSKRGGTSGIGINTYFEGGFIFDVGIKSDEQSFNPSSIADRNGKTPLVIHKCKLPDWEVGICIPKYIQSKSEQEEIDFFKTYCPIEKNSIESILYEAVYGITSSITENDYDVFCKSVNTIQSTQWKYLERLIYGEALVELEQKIKLLGADCVGMSSLGPILFFTGKNINSITERISHDFPETICYNASFNNKGRVINYD
jgi:beta-ribofuranosylaminobenzene 5'-phosphate synthase